MKAAKCRHTRSAWPKFRGWPSSPRSVSPNEQAVSTVPPPNADETAPTPEKRRRRISRNLTRSLPIKDANVVARGKHEAAGRQPRRPGEGSGNSVAQFVSGNGRPGWPDRAGSAHHHRHWAPHAAAPASNAWPDHSAAHLSHALQAGCLGLLVGHGGRGLRDDRRNLVSSVSICPRCFRSTCAALAAVLPPMWAAA
jgi:hypothetical protein